MAVLEMVGFFFAVLAAPDQATVLYFTLVLAL